MIHGGNVWQGGKPTDWLDYSANIRPEGAPDWVREALRSAMKNVSYYPDPQMKCATEAMAQYLGVPAECVRPTAGGISAIQMANRLDSRETVILTPCFCEYEQFATSPIRRVSLLREGHGVAIDEELHLHEGSLVWLCNPQNPVGAAFGRRQIEGLLKQVEAAQGWLAVDEAFIEYCPQHSVIDMIEGHERLLITGSMTKILGIPGVRLGYLCAQQQVLRELQRHQLTWELSCFAEAVARALPAHRMEIRVDSQMNACRRENMRSRLEALGVFVYPSEAAFLLADFGRNVEPIAQYLKEHHILVRSCMSFEGLNDGHHLRLAVKDAKSNQRFMDTLREAMTCVENR